MCDVTSFNLIRNVRMVFSEQVLTKLTISVDTVLWKSQAPTSNRAGDNDRIWGNITFPPLSK